MAQLLQRNLSDRVMLSVRRLVRRFLGYFCALNGIVNFYMDYESDKLRWSRCLVIYRILQNFIVLIMSMKFFFNFWEILAEEMEKSTLMTINFLIYFALVFLTLISCMACTYRWQKRIFRIFNKLQRQKKLCEMMGYRVPKEKQLYMDRLLYILTALLILRLGIHVAMFVFQAELHFKHPCNCFFSECMIFAMSYLFFALLAKICQSWWRLEFGLKMLIFNQKPIPVSRQLGELCRLRNMFQSLINLLSELCSIFQWVLLCYLARNIWSGIVVGYLEVRLVYRYGRDDEELMYLGLGFVICLQPIMLSCLLSTISFKTCSLLEETRDLLKTPHKRSAQVEQSVEWWSLQLAWQHTCVSIFGTFRLNRALAFQHVAVIWLHTLYLVQSNYYFLTK
ncbi:putative gustatory receptor 85a [Drosophila ficusphila]|uniref:putative gustatory receptor 85a n=1 Tax=Drosophila ficusphila TaxID=30025 RepID=UPI001C88EC4C|nr:putative gustatory receptor 85a [Drosophila ficusphila]